MAKIDVKTLMAGWRQAPPRIWDVIRDKIESYTTEQHAMIILTWALALIGTIANVPVWLGLALLPAFRWGQLDVRDDVETVCDTCLRHPMIEMEDETQTIAKKLRNR